MSFLGDRRNKKSLLILLACICLLKPWLASSPALASSDHISDDAPIARVLPDARLIASTARTGDDNRLRAGAAQAASILGVGREAEQILSMRARPLSDAERHQLNLYRALVLRKILLAALQVQSAENRLESELAYTYDVLARTQRKEDNVNQLFNIANFTQLGILYGILEPWSRIDKKFVQSAVGTCVGSGLAVGLPLLNIMYNRFFSRATHLTPPGFISHMIDGKPVDGSNLPALVAKYLDTPVVGSDKTRRQALNLLWKKRYRADMDKKETLAGIDDGKSKKTIVLNTRIVLLWSLFTAIQGFDRDLLSLLNQVTGFETPRDHPAKTTVGNLTGLPSGADEAARLLGLESVVAELKALEGSADSERKIELQIRLLEAVLSGFLDMQLAIDRCQEELNYQYDVVLAQMTARRGKFLQKTYEANFIQTGTLGATAGLLYLKHYSKVGNQMFMIENGIGLGITTISLLGTHGGWRRNTTEPNSLSDFFDLRSTGIHGFSPLVWNFLNCTSGKDGGDTRREKLQKLWVKRSVANLDLNKKRNQEKLGSMPSCRWDTIKLVRNRIALLTSLSEQFGQFDEELLELLRHAWPVTSDAASNIDLPLNATAKSAATLLGVNSLVAEANRSADIRPRLDITRLVLDGFLSCSADAHTITQEIVAESQVVNEMTKRRDLAIQLTNITNFYQIGVLGIISDSLGVSTRKNYALYGDRVNLVSGGLILGLAGASFIERQGGVRLSKAPPNQLSAAFGRSSTAKLSPSMVRYLDSTSPYSPDHLTRREALVKYWRESKVLNVNVKHDSTVDKLSAEGKAYHWWSETIKLINNRVTMLYDLRAVLRSSNVGFAELVNAVE